VSQFYMRKITLTTARVTIRPGLPHLAVAPFVQLHLHNKYVASIDRYYVIN